jgi:hypothetical protein
MKSGLLTLVLAVVVFCVGSVAIPACVSDACKKETTPSLGCVIEQDTVDCSGGDLSGAIAIFGPEFQQLVASAKNADGSVNWTSILPALAIDVIKYGACVVSAVWDTYMNPTAAPATSSSVVGGGTSLAPVPLISPAEAKTGYEMLRKHSFGGKHVHLKTRTL